MKYNVENILELFEKWLVNGKKRGGMENYISVLLGVNASFSENA